MAYLWLKTLHIVGVVAWMAGLFYLVRIFVYHAEARAEAPAARAVLERQYALMESRALRIIATPAAVITVATATGMLVLVPGLLSAGWLHAKLALVLLLVAYHVGCARWRTQLADPASAVARWSGQRFRMLNEVPTVLLLGIAMLAVFKDRFPTSAGAWAMVLFTLALLVAIQLYAKYRRRRATGLAPNA